MSRVETLNSSGQASHSAIECVDDEVTAISNGPRGAISSYLMLRSTSLPATASTLAVTETS
ncbi:hypothetical protein [Lentzea sp. HUAS12]|uniref:hypothetical protein n=1 Tax=Lentzea sp. HUAS12 TaxID=2951806 RepID=UPI00209E65B5|nr:hypothetical protein [Lentzea sp. HUAS12]USX48864.1 hypothetical protein ND450_25775 [Lentzea sp. HUAS12]